MHLIIQERGAMEPMVRLRGIPSIQPIRIPVLEGSCAHGRMIDEVRTRGGGTDREGSLSGVPSYH
jgi:hypothetical protein